MAVARTLYTLIGDLVGSRQVPDRSAVQTALHVALDEVNDHLAPAQRFEPTVGDEYQGACTTLADAARAALLVRLALLPVADARCGIGHGELTVHDATRRPLLQDGPGWWSARPGPRVHGRTERSGGPAGAGRLWAVPETQQAPTDSTRTTLDTVAVATDERETLETGLVFRSVGYQGVELPGVLVSRNHLGNGGNHLSPGQHLSVPRTAAQARACIW